MIDPFDPASRGKLVDLREYPGLAQYLAGHESVLTARHVARRRPDAWYRTIDRIWPELAKQPKLLIPDIQPANSATVGFDAGDPNFLSRYMDLRNVAAPQVPVPAQEVAVAAYGDEAHVEENRQNVYRSLR